MVGEGGTVVYPGRPREDDMHVTAHRYQSRVEGIMVQLTMKHRDPDLDTGQEVREAVVVADLQGRGLVQDRAPGLLTAEESTSQQRNTVVIQNRRGLIGRSPPLDREHQNIGPRMLSIIILHRT